MLPADTVEFSRPLSLDRISTTQHHEEIAATDKERAALAKRFGQLSLDRLEASFTLKRVRKDLVRVKGRLAAELAQACVVTLDPVTFDLRPEIFLMLKPGPPAQRSAKSKTPAAAVGKSRPSGPGIGKAPLGEAGKRRPDKPGRDLVDAAPSNTTDTYSGEEIVLDEFVREFLLLELPLYPRRPDLPSAEESIDSRPLAGPTGEKSIDPRLEPLKKLAARLRGEANKE